MKTTQQRFLENQQDPKVVAKEKAEARLKNYTYEQLQQIYSDTQRSLTVGYLNHDPKDIEKEAILDVASRKITTIKAEAEAEARKIATIKAEAEAEARKIATIKAEKQLESFSSEKLESVYSTAQKTVMLDCLNHDPINIETEVLLDVSSRKIATLKAEKELEHCSFEQLQSIHSNSQRDLTVFYMANKGKHDLKKEATRDTCVKLMENKSKAQIRK